jgi:hypothetical protein
MQYYQYANLHFVLIVHAVGVHLLLPGHPIFFLSERSEEIVYFPEPRLRQSPFNSTGD